MNNYEQTLRNQVTELDNMERAGIFHLDPGMKAKADAERDAITAALDELARLRAALALADIERTNARCDATAFKVLLEEEQAENGQHFAHIQQLEASLAEERAVTAALTVRCTNSIKRKIRQDATAETARTYAAEHVAHVIAATREQHRKEASDVR